MQAMNEQYMQRAVQLAKAGLGYTAPNPMVGAVLVHNDRIIGEGFHQKYGEVHAEVNCINSVKREGKSLISRSTLYVTLEPCSHFGKTPPCADLIIRKNIPNVVIGSIDPFPKVSGSGIEKLKRAGIEVITGVLKNECAALNKRFFTFHKKKRPYIILKWAQSKDGFIALPGPKPVKISHSLTDRVVHRWRSEEQAILIGSGTALADNPQLTNRLWSGNSPMRIVLDRKATLPSDLRLLNDDQPTLVYTLNKTGKQKNTEWIKLSSKENFVEEVIADLFKRNYLSLIVEGGAKILNDFIEKNLWDEARIITGNRYLQNGLRAPQIKIPPVKEYILAEDRIVFIENKE